MNTSIIKMDDLDETTVHSFFRVYKICKKYNIRPSFGIIGSSLENCSADYIDMLTTMIDDGVEIWNHGYLHNTMEFSHSSYEAQFNSIKLTQGLCEKKLGYIPCTFGSPYNNSGGVTSKVLYDNFDEITNYYYISDGHKNSTKNNLVSRCRCEKTAGCIDYNLFFSDYERLKTCEYMVMQFHPAKWNEQDFYYFDKMVRTLLEDGVRILTARDFKKVNSTLSFEYENIVDDFFKIHSRIYMYGAGEIGRELYKYFSRTDRSFEGFIVSDGQTRQEKVFEKPVMYISDFMKKMGSDVGVVIAGTDDFVELIRAELKSFDLDVLSDVISGDWNCFIDYIRMIVT